MPKKILVVDDNQLIRDALCSFIKKRGYACAADSCASNGREGLKWFRERVPDLVILDIRMPGLSGLDLLEIIKEERPDCPVIMMSGHSDPEEIITCLKLGADDFLEKPFDSLKILEEAIDKAFIHMEDICEKKKYRIYLEDQLRSRTNEIETYINQLRDTISQTLKMVAAVVEVRDPYTAGHQHRVAHLAKAIAEEMGLSVRRTEGLYLAGEVHDFGKIAVPAEILAKPSKLTDTEFTLIKDHCRIGYDLLKDIEFPWPIADVVYQHHEKLDGTGYPQGLSNGNILLEAKILTVADVVEAMASHRPYRPARGCKATYKHIKSGRGILYDKDIVDVCLDLFQNKSYSLTK